MVAMVEGFRSTNIGAWAHRQQPLDSIGVIIYLRSVLSDSLHLKFWFFSLRR
jgi:hypothetical protein